MHTTHNPSIHSDEGLTNTCTLVPTVFLRQGKTEFELPFSFSIFLWHEKTEFQFPFSFSVFLLHWKRNSNYYFRFFVSTQLWKTEKIKLFFRFSSFVFVRRWKTEFELRFCFSFPCFCHFRISPKPEESPLFLSIKKAWNQEDRWKAVQFCL